MLGDWIQRALASVGGQPAPRAESRTVHGILVEVINTREDIDT